MAKMAQPVSVYYQARSQRYNLSWKKMFTTFRQKGGILFKFLSGKDIHEIFSL